MTEIDKEKQEENTTQEAKETEVSQEVKETPEVKQEPKTPLMHEQGRFTIMSITNYLIPLSIVIGFGLVAGAILINGTGGLAPTDVKGDAQQAAQPAEKNTTENIRPVTDEDHIKGNPNAQVMIVEYSDMSCPFCKRFHDTLNQVLEEHGGDNQVAWTFRQFPIPQLHPRNATAVAMASECATEFGGNDMFWKFTDRWFELTLTNDRTDIATVLPQIYGEVGLDRAQMESCIESGKYLDRIQKDRDNAIATGGGGTPWSVVIAPNGKTFPLSGAQPVEAVRQLIQVALQEK